MQNDISCMKKLYLNKFYASDWLSDWSQHSRPISFQKRYFFFSFCCKTRLFHQLNFQGKKNYFAIFSHGWTVKINVSKQMRKKWEKKKSLSERIHIYGWYIETCVVVTQHCRFNDFKSTLKCVRSFPKAVLPCKRKLIGI